MISPQRLVRGECWFMVGLSASAGGRVPREILYDRMKTVVGGEDPDGLGVRRPQSRTPQPRPPLRLPAARLPPLSGQNQG
jgi:hypothetical protein